MSYCTKCGSPLSFVQQYNQWYCQTCRQYQPGPVVPAGPATEQVQQQVPVMAVGGAWFQEAYRIRKKVMALTNQYWIEDPQGRVLGFSKQKAFKLKEDIRIYTDQTMGSELFRIQQQQIVDTWGTFAVLDSATGGPLGYVRRKALASSFLRDEWELYDASRQLIGGIHESTGRGLARKYLPGGGLIPEKTTLELQGQPVAEINQKFKVVGDIWEVRCTSVPPNFDRRVLLSLAILMGMIERRHK